MGGRGSGGARNTTNAASPTTPRTILEDEVRSTPLYNSIIGKGVERTFASSLTRAVIMHPDQGSITQENYSFYNLTGRQFNSQMQNMRKELEKQGYDVMIENVDRKDGGELRLVRGRGFQRTSVQHYTVRKISWRRKQ